MGYIEGLGKFQIGISEYRGPTIVIYVGSTVCAYGSSTEATAAYKTANTVQASLAHGEEVVDWSLDVSQHLSFRGDFMFQRHVERRFFRSYIALDLSCTQRAQRCIET